MGDNIALGYLDSGDESFHISHVHWDSSEPIADIAVFVTVNGYDEWENQIEAFFYASRFNGFRFDDERESLLQGMLFYNNNNIEPRKFSSEVDRLESLRSYIVSNISDEEFEVMIYKYNNVLEKIKFKKSNVRKQLMKFIFSPRDIPDYRAIYEKS